MEEDSEHSVHEVIVICEICMEKPADIAVNVEFIKDVKHPGFNLLKMCSSCFLRLRRNPDIRMN